MIQMLPRWLAPLVLAAVLALPAAAFAQAEGRITGRVLDAATARPLAGAQVSVQGTALRASAGVDGRYTLERVPAGSHTLVVSLLGHGTKTVTGVAVQGGRTAEMDVTLSAAVLLMEGLTVTARVERGSVNRALDEQRTAVGVVSAIGSEQISRSPDGDAAQAMQRVSGVTVADGRTVFVRGLGERYTTIALNGARMPSPDPERRDVPLDLFPAGMLQSVAAQKTFTPDLPGDFAGAQVNVTTREFPSARRIVFSTSGGFNAAATGQNVLTAPSLGQEWLAFGAGPRRAPQAVSTPEAVRGLTTDDAMRSAVQQLRYGVLPAVGTGAPNSSMSLSVGGEDAVLGRTVGYLASAQYGFSQEARVGEVHANPYFHDGSVQVLEEWRGATGRTSATLGGLLNLSTRLGDGHRISFDNAYTRTMDNEAREDAGYTDYFQVRARRSTLRYVERALRSSQLRGEHALGRGHRLDWTLSSAGVGRYEPDRTDVVYVETVEAGSAFWALPVGDPYALRRTFGDLREDNVSTGADYRLPLGGAGSGAVVRFGGLYTYTHRDAQNFQFSVIPQSLPHGTSAAGTPEEIFGRAGEPDARFRIASSNEAGSYVATEHRTAGYVMAELPMGARVRVIGGARVENADLRLNTTLAGGATTPIARSDLDVLPSLVVNVRMSDAQTLRFSATQTLARPEYRELSPFAYLEVIGGVITKGNESLQRSLIRSADAKWELYPGAGEVLSLGVFAKQFSRPIERVDVATGGPPQVTFVNADAAFNVGAEVEARMGLGRLAGQLDPFSLFSNVTLMHSRIDIGEGVSANTHASRPMIGQAPYVVNAGLNYQPAPSTSATLLYNVVGPRIWAAGAVPFPDIYERERHLLDVALRFPLWRGTAARLDARNLLDAASVRRQGPVERERYRSGRVFSFGVSWQQ
jgi:hypothetical protein